MRRHHRLRGSRRGPTGRRHPLLCALRKARRKSFPGVGGARQHPLAQFHRHGSVEQLRQETAVARRHGHPLWSSLDRPHPLSLLRRAAVQLQPRPASRSVDGPSPGGLPEEPVLAGHRQHQQHRPDHGASRWSDAEEAGQPVLQEPSEAPGSTVLRSNPADEPTDGGHGELQRREWTSLGCQVRRGHGEDGLHRRAHRKPRRDQEAVLGRELMMMMMMIYI